MPKSPKTFAQVLTFSTAVIYLAFAVFIATVTSSVFVGVNKSSLPYPASVNSLLVLVINEVTAEFCLSKRYLVVCICVLILSTVIGEVGFNKLSSSNPAAVSTVLILVM